MKKKILCAVLIASILMSGCGKKEYKEIKYTERQFDYGIENVISFALDGEDIWVSQENNEKLAQYDKEGKLLNEINIGGELNSIACCGDTLFGFASDDKGATIKEINKSNGEIKENKMPEGISEIYSLIATKDKVYGIYFFQEEAEEVEEETDEDDGYMDLHEHAVVFDRKNYKMKELPIKNVIGMTQVDEENIEYYAHDKNGYYFTTYNCKTGKFGEKKYNNTYGYQFGFAVDSKQNKVICNDIKESRIVLGTVDKEDKSEFLDNVFLANGNDIHVQNSECYVRDGNSKRITRISCDDAVKNNKKITFYKTSEIDNPYGCGYNIKAVYPSSEEFALSVLAGDSDFDLCLTSSSEEYATKMRDQKAYYGLNDVPNVMKYLDECFTYVKEAAMTSEKEVWMIPVYVE